MATEPQAPPSKSPSFIKSLGLKKRQEEDGKQQGDMTIPKTSVADMTQLSPPTLTTSRCLETAQTSNANAELEKQREEERVEEELEERKGVVNEQPRKKPFWLDDDDLPPMMWDAH